MGRQSLDCQINNFIDEFNQSVYHPILNRDIGMPELDESTLFFLLLPKLNGEDWTSSTNQAAIAVGAVYAAFEAHDLVNAENVTTTDQQLRVLAGDYLSGIYYQLLASLPNFKFIHVLSKAIGRINEIKTDLHSNSEHIKGNSLEAIEKIQAKCIIEFFKTFGFDKYIPLACTGLTLQAFIQNEDAGVKNKLIKQTLHNQDVAEELLQLRAEMEEAIENACFLSPHLQEKVREKTLPLLGKMI